MSFRPMLREPLVVLYNDHWPFTFAVWISYVVFPQ